MKMNTFCIQCKQIRDSNENYCWNCSTPLRPLVGSDYCKECKYIPNYESAYTDKFCRNCGSFRV